VNINSESVSFETISLNQNAAPELEKCGIDLWKSDEGEPKFNYRLIPLYIKQMLFHRYFWYGILFAVILFFSLRLFLKLFRKKKNAA
jgi:hypothetical protein